MKPFLCGSMPAMDHALALCGSIKFERKNTCSGVASWMDAVSVIMTSTQM
ncbi:hypothetical protein GXY_11184 [Novacetimonas hansenii ATCC 23769]|uniref:Uncharacterized protein n=1 Tax=Novacetimonas hansenii ATCC 23769 TaxID=714995 RepID=D5QGG5_NOVHA|nr:hypothetical protein GXY_11184 [Novacetimonas hansenii ATCC 23769]